MILIGLGANQTGPWGDAAQSLNTAIESLRQVGLTVEAASGFLVTAPMGGANQPDYVNAVVSVSSHLPPAALLQRLHAIEREGGRRRARRWGPRSLDLDLLDWHGTVHNWPPASASLTGGAAGHIPLTLPHPGIALRPFVLVPIAQIAPKWRHAVLHLSAGQMLSRLGRQKGGHILRKI